MHKIIFPNRTGSYLRQPLHHNDTSIIPPISSPHRLSETVVKGKVTRPKPDYVYENNDNFTECIDIISNNCDNSDNSDNSDNLTQDVDNMFEILSMPTMTDRDLQTLLGNDFSLAHSITREELCKRQNQDKDLNMIKGDFNRSEIENH